MEMIHDVTEDELKQFHIMNMHGMTVVRKDGKGVKLRAMLGQCGSLTRYGAEVRFDAGSYVTYGPTRGVFTIESQDNFK